jgi:hypothetical protein
MQIFRTLRFLTGCERFYIRYTTAMDLSTLYGMHNQSFFDSYWSVVHFATGIIIGRGLIYLYHYLQRPLTNEAFKYIGFSSLVVWEYFEVILRYLDTRHVPLGEMLDTILPHGFFEIESSLNIISDLLLGGFGLFLAYYFWKRDGKEK